MYVLLIAVLMCAAYVAMRVLFPYFFNQSAQRFGRETVLSIALIVSVSVLISFGSFLITDPELSNRVLHALGGGFLGILMCWLAARDSGVRMTRFQFAVLSGLIVLALGVGNEVLEFGLQEFAGITFARTIDDVWLDLVSNVVGVTLGILALTPLHRQAD